MDLLEGVTDHLIAVRLNLPGYRNLSAPVRSSRSEVADRGKYNGKEVSRANVTIDIPDELVRRLEGLASAHNQTVQQFALERLSNAAAAEAGSPAAVLEAMFAPPRLAESDVAELEDAIATGRLLTTDHDIFAE